MAEISHEKANNSESNRVSKYKTEIVVETKEGLELAMFKGKLRKSSWVL